MKFYRFLMWLFRFRPVGCRSRFKDFREFALKFFQKEFYVTYCSLYINICHTYIILIIIGILFL